MMCRPFLIQFQQFNDDIEDEVILNFISEIEEHIAYIKGNDINAD